MCGAARPGPLPRHAAVLAVPTERARWAWSLAKIGWGPRGIFAREISPSALDWRLQKVIWTTWGQDAEGPGAGSGWFPFSPHAPSLQTPRPGQLSSRAKEGLTACSWPPQQRAPEQSSGGWVGEGISTSLPAGRCGKHWAVLSAHRCPGVHLHRCSLLGHGCVCTCVHPCGCVQVCTVSVYLGVSMSALLRHNCLFLSVLGGVYAHVFAHFLFAHASTACVPVYVCVHAGACVTRA